MTDPITVTIDDFELVRGNYGGVTVLAKQPMFCVAHDGETESVTVETIRIDFMEFLRNLNEQKREVLAAWGTDAEFLLMGSEEYAAMMRTAYHHGAFQFDVQGVIVHETEHDVMRQRTHHRTRILDMPVRVCPSVRGYCIVPKVSR